MVEEFEGRVDAQEFVDGGVDVFRAERAGEGAVALRVGRADDLAAADAAAGQEAEHGLAPVVAARVPMLSGGPPLPPLFIRGVRLNSPHSMTSVESNRPRSVKSVSRLDSSESTIGRTCSMPDCKFQ